MVARGRSRRKRDEQMDPISLENARAKASAIFASQDGFDKCISTVSFIVCFDPGVVHEVWFTRAGTAHLKDPNAKIGGVA